MVVHPSSRRRRWALLAVLMRVAAAVLLFFLLRRPADAPDEDAPAPSSASRAPAPAPARPAGPSSDAPEPTPPVAERPRCSLPFTGRIVSSEDGRPVIGAEVTFLAPEGATSVRTGPDGRFRLVPSRAGPHQLAAVLAEGYVPFGPAWGQSPSVSSPRRRPARRSSCFRSTRGAVERPGRGGGRGSAHRRRHRRAPDRGRAAGLLGPERSWTTDAQGAFSGGAPPEAWRWRTPPGSPTRRAPAGGAGTRAPSPSASRAGPRVLRRTGCSPGEWWRATAFPCPRRW
jgi:hypothetical protein